MQKKSYHPPELTELGYLRDLVAQGRPKTGPDTDGEGEGEISKSPDVPASDQFTRGSRSSSDESSGGRSGRN